MHSGVGLEKELCGQEGCIWTGNPVEQRPQPWQAIRFYESRFGDDQNPCDIHDTCLGVSNPDSPEEFIYEQYFNNPADKTER